MKTLELPAGTEYVQFDEVAHRLADALWPATGPDDERWAYACACLNFESALKAAVRDGTLPVKDPLTRLPHTFPHGAALHTALVTVGDLVAFAAGSAIDVKVCSPATEAAQVTPEVESLEQRRARWLDWRGKSERGSLQRVYERELLQNPRADRSYIGKEIKKAKTERDEKKRAGVMFGQLVQDGKRTG